MEKKTVQFFATKKGVSPLIATVLLIAFAVALGAVVMNWGRGYVEDTADAAKDRSDREIMCSSEIDLDIVSIDGVSQICYNKTVSGNYTIWSILENRRSRTIENVSIRVIGENSKVPQTGFLGIELTANGADLGNFSYEYAAMGVPAQVVYTPYVRIGDTVVPCSGNVEKYKSLVNCSEIW
ncbi:hypothetical protein HN587_07785 [Candidatus Woesearchaeota archaeon]|jgi:flagellin-like protein|nr:hypothetical protein [Candidatus Woesearchaeota archaeon]